MANIKKFEDPVQMIVRVERDTKDLIKKVAVNQNDFVNEAIKEKLSRTRGV